MHREARDVPAGAVLEAEICVVGAGPAGLTLAVELSRAGRQVLVLESGGLAYDAAAQQLNHGRVVGGPYADLRGCRHRRVGGTAHLWNTMLDGTSGWAKLVPLDARDLDARPDAWPVGSRALLPYYRRAHRLCGLDSHDWDPIAGGDGDRALPSLGDGLEPRLYRFAHATPWVRDHPRELLASATALLLTGATATRLETDQDGARVREMRVATAAGLATVRARHVVLAAGAIENARLLLASGEHDRTPGNAAGLVGVGFMEHPRDLACRLASVDARTERSLAFLDARRTPDGTIVCGRIAPSDATLERERLPAFSVTLLPIRDGSVRERVVHRLLGRPIAPTGYGWTAQRPAWRRDTAFRAIVNLEQRAHAENRVTLGRECDRHGVPLPELHWRWRDEEQQELERIRALLRDRFAAASLGRLHWSPGSPPDPNAHHHAGTTRMHADPRCGVVDADGRVHGMENLWITGASVFPRAGFANPTLSIVALAIRLADRLALA